MPPRRRPRRSCRRSRACTTRMAAEVADAGHLLEPLLALHQRVRDAVVDACTRQASERLAAVASDVAEGGDTSYAIDRVREETFVPGLSDVSRAQPLSLAGE